MSFQPRPLTEALCVHVVRGKACGHTVLKHCIPAEALNGQPWDTREPEPCSVDGCECPDFKAFL